MEKHGVLQKACIIVVVCAATAIASPAQNFTTLFHFDGTDGATPYAGLIQATDGNFYGTTGRGGAYTSCDLGCGTVFKITPAGTLTTLHSFDSTDGANPDAGLVQATDGNFYGTTVGGGSSGNCQGGCGTVFQITPGGTLITLYSFCAQTNCTDGSEPYAGLVQSSDGNFYGTTYSGGAEGEGTVFRITVAGTLTTLYSFCAQTNCTDGIHPSAGLIQASDGNFYGTTQLGGYGTYGTVFKMTPTGALTTLHSFDLTDGAWPYAGLIQATDGNFYGTTELGGTSCGSFGCGTVFKITAAGALTTLYRFCALANCPDGRLPSAGLIQATDGNFYGTTSNGRERTYGTGTVFEITAGGTLGTLYTFCAQTNCTDGGFPYAGLIQASDGNFYGTTAGGGANGDGTVFRLAAVPAVTLSPTSLSFGNQALDETSAAKTVTLRNSGTALLIMSGVAIQGSSFAISANTCGAALAMGKACKVSVTFTPTVLGKLTGTLTFTDNASNSPQTVPLSGKGVEPATLTPASATYATQTVGTTSPAKTFTLTNNQSVALTSIAISTTGDFAASATTCSTTLAAKSKCTISVTFTPTATGTRTGKLSVSDSASNSPQTSNLKGTGS